MLDCKLHVTKIQFTLYNLEVSLVYDDDWNVFNFLPVMKSYIECIQYPTSYEELYKSCHDMVLNFQKTFF